jgi:cell division protein FtsL
MKPLALLLVAAVLGTALLLVDTSYDSRRLFAALERARADEQELDAEFRRLDAERRAASTRLRVEQVARERLRMHGAHPGVTLYVPDPGAPASSATSSAAAAEAAQ